MNIVDDERSKARSSLLSELQIQLIEIIPKMETFPHDLKTPRDATRRVDD